MKEVNRFGAYLREMGSQERACHSFFTPNTHSSLIFPTILFTHTLA